jgi:molybdopterin/thiamine biosynthesis adenylyltransferase
MSLPPEIQALQASAVTARAEFGAGNLKLITVPFNGIAANAICLALPPRAELYLIPTALFPEAPPYAVMNWGDGSDATLLPLEWDRGVPVDQRLCAALRKFITPPGPYRPVWGPSQNAPCTEDAEVARRAGWSRFLAGFPLLGQGTSQSLQARIETGLAKSLRSSVVVIVGLGSVGSFIAEHLARSGVGHLVCIDHDRVEPSNLSRTCYRVEHIGQLKADALKRIVHEINPSIQVESFGNMFRDVGNRRLREIFDSADLLIGATDDPQTQILISRCAFYVKKPGIFVALYRGAQGGEVAISVPTVTPCFECMVRPQRRVANQSDIVSGADYGTGRLQGEIALGCDIHHVCTAGLKIAMSLLAALKSTDPIPLASFVSGALSKSFHYLTIGIEPNYWFYPQIFKEAAGQYGYQAVWLSASGQEDCSVCGQGQPEDPFDLITPSLRPDSLRGLA